MEKLAFCFLLLCCVVAVSFHFGVKYGERKTRSDFRKQVQNHKAFYEHNLKASCGKKFYAVNDI